MNEHRAFEYNENAYLLNFVIFLCSYTVRVAAAYLIRFLNHTFYGNIFFAKSEKYVYLCMYAHCYGTDDNHMTKTCYVET